MERQGLKIEASDGFRRAYTAMSWLLRIRIDQTIKKLIENPTLPGLHVERIRGASENVHSCRVTKGIRLIYEILDSGIARLLYVGNHDVAYRETVSYLLLAKTVEEMVPAEGFGGLAMFKSYRDYVEEGLREI